MINRLVFILLLTCQFVAMGLGYGQDKQSILMLEKSLNTDLNDTTRLNTLIALADYYKNPKTSLFVAKDYSQKAFELADNKKLKVPYKLIWIKAELLTASEMPNKAIDEMKPVIEELKKLNRFQEIAEAQNFIAYSTFYSGKFRQGIEIYHNNIEYARKNHLKQIIPQAWLGIATIYNWLKNKEEEKAALSMYLEESNIEGDSNIIAKAYRRLGLFFSSVDSNFVASIDCLKNSLGIYKSQNDSSQVQLLSNSVAWNFYLNKQLDSSLFYYKQSLDFATSDNHTRIANTYGNIANVYRNKKDYDQAQHFYRLAEEYCIKTHDLYDLSWINKDMSDMYITMGDYKKAYQHYVLYKNYSDSLVNTKYDAGLADARTRYETETKEKTLELLNLKLAQHEYLIYGFGAFIGFVLIIGFLFFRQARVNSKRKMSEMSFRLSEITQANLRQQMNPHFIFNTLNSIQYFMYQHDKLATNNYLTKFSSLIRKILENSQVMFVSIKDELDVIQLYLELETLRFKDKFSYEITIDDEIDTLSYKVPTMLIQPYVENAICHGLMNKDENGKLKLEMSLKENFILCVIEDNGVGREVALEIKKLKSTSHQSLGIKITESRIDLSNAVYGTDMKVVIVDLKDENNQACGTRIELYLPIMS